MARKAAERAAEAAQDAQILRYIEEKDKREQVGGRQPTDEGRKREGGLSLHRMRENRDRRMPGGGY